MSEVEELEIRVQSLPAVDLAKFHDWYTEFTNRRLLVNDLTASFGLLKARKSVSLEDIEAAIAGSESDDD